MTRIIWPNGYAARRRHRIDGELAAAVVAVAVVAFLLVFGLWTGA